jgi:hypothetical protein
MHLLLHRYLYLKNLTNTTTLYNTMFPSFVLRVIPVIIIGLGLLFASAAFSMIILVGLAVAHICSHWIGSSANISNPYMKCSQTPENAYTTAPPFVSPYLPWTTVTYSYLCVYMATLITIHGRVIYNLGMVFALAGVWVVDACWLGFMSNSCYRWREILIASLCGAGVGTLWAYISGNPATRNTRNIVYFGPTTTTYR